MKNLIKTRNKKRNDSQNEDWPKDYLEKVNCPLCKSTSYRKIYPKIYKRVVLCDNCHLIYTNPRLKKKHLKHLYSEDYFHNSNSSHFGYENYLGDEKKIIKTFSKRIASIEKTSHGKKGKLLDIGCATGFFLKAARDRNWDVEGVEISEFAAKYARKHFKFKIYQNDFLNLNLPNNYYDVITMWDVIEHLYHPRAALSKIYKLLKPNGLLIFSTPDVTSLPSKLTRDKWVGYKLSDEHLTYFSTNTAKHLIENSGFSVIKKNYVGKYVSLPMLSDRASLYHPLLGKIISIFEKFFPKNYSLYVNPFDIMCIYAKKDSS